MHLSEVRQQAIAPALALLPTCMTSPAAEVMLLAIGLQESAFRYRHQIGGPAHGYWMFEPAGVRGVLRHAASHEHALQVCNACGVQPVGAAVHAALEHDDTLAAAFARLLLWTDPAPLPAVGAVGAAWDLYLKTWRPGRPHRSSWDPLYTRVLEAVREVSA
ncbi:hypothetical protein ACE0DR_15025 [Azotobacter sp. CWF10]